MGQEGDRERNAHTQGGWQVGEANRICHVTIKFFDAG